jgi:hypothetical protein
MTFTSSFKSVSDDKLLERLLELSLRSRRVEADLVSHIAEVDQRRLYARKAYPSMFAYSTQVLHLSEGEAYLRITAARASRKHPELLSMLRDGRLHLSSIERLAPHITTTNKHDLLKRATHKTKKQVELILAELAPKPDIPTSVRRLPKPRTVPGPAPQLRPDGVARASELRPDEARQATPSHDATLVPPAPKPVPYKPAVIEPLAPARFKVQFTASAELHDKLDRLRDLMRSSVPAGDLAQLIEVAVTEKLERLEARRYGKTAKPRKTVKQADTAPTTRHIPAPIRRVVHERDGGRCRFVDEGGRRCEARLNLEFHHDHAYGRGGDHSAANVMLLCSSHNQYLADLEYGKDAMNRYRDGVSEAVAVYASIAVLGAQERRLGVV